MTDAERKASAGDRSRMQSQPQTDSNKQGGEMSQYSKQKKEEKGARIVMSVAPEAIIAHYASVWANEPEIRRWNKGPASELPEAFCILEFRPTKARQMWTYSTCGMSSSSNGEPIELHLFSPQQYEPLVELLTIVAHYHCTSDPLGLGHTVNFGRPWISGSRCDHGLVSLPYLDGPDLEEFRPAGTADLIRFLWLIPITKAERDFKKSNGLDAIQQKFEDANFNYVDPTRPSVV